MFEKVIDFIIAERTLQDERFGDINKSNTAKDWLPILGEEFGEVNTAILNNDKDNLKEELIQVAAVAIQWLEQIFEQENTNTRS
jgi:NTP pyrophosphatase (non-canonical NTP hydrolase)